MAACLTPFQTKENKLVPCGKCPRCKARNVSAWSFRLMTEYKRAYTADWITLTYDPMKMYNGLTRKGKAITRITPKGWMTLCKKDVQLFIKKLRQAHGKSWSHPIRYFCVGEYGGRFNRPHYHITIFNARRELLQEAWGLGQLFYGEVTYASTGYTLKYMMKPGKIPMHQNDDRVKEFRIMSKGLGSNYLTPAMIKWHKADLANRMYIPIEDGKKISMPRYYKDKLYNTEERQVISKAYELRVLDEFYKLIERDGIDNKKFRAQKAKIEFELNKSHKKALEGRDKKFL